MVMKTKRSENVDTFGGRIIHALRPSACSVLYKTFGAW